MAITPKNQIKSYSVFDVATAYNVGSVVSYLGSLYRCIKTDDYNTDATSPSTMADDATVGTVAWDNPDNAKVSDDAYAVAVLSTTKISHYLKATNFGFTIPVNATINGILVEIEGKVNSGEGVLADIRIVKGGAIGTTTKTNDKTTPVTTTDTYFSIPLTGYSTDLWGETWTPADINAANFGVVIGMQTGFIAKTYSIDHIRITVYYPGSVGNLPTDTIYWKNICTNQVKSSAVSPTNQSKSTAVSPTNQSKS